MTTRTKFVAGIVLLLAVVLVLEYRMPRHFDWTPTFAHADAQPFGCMVFDSVMQASLPHGYSVQKQTLWQMKRNGTFATPKSLLIVTTEGIDVAEVNTLLQLVDEGHNVMVATDRLTALVDTLGGDWDYNSTFVLGNVAGRSVDKDTLQWMPQIDAYMGEPLSVPVYGALIACTLELPDTMHTMVLGYKRITDDEDRLLPVALRYAIGKGQLTLVSAPLLFTNYMTLTKQGAQLQARLMNNLQEHPVIRMESFMSGTALKETSPFYVFLKEPPLRWALYLTLLTMLLFCIFTARRRQRVVPVVQKPDNRNLEFVRLIGSLYWQEHDNAGLLAKKLAYVTDDIRRQHAKLPESDQYFLKQMEKMAGGQYAVSNQELKIYIKELNRIQQSL